MFPPSSSDQRSSQAFRVWLLDIVMNERRSKSNNVLFKKDIMPVFGSLVDYFSLGWGKLTKPTKGFQIEDNFGPCNVLGMTDNRLPTVF